ncbi:uncharacterized protein BXZ73DRAFT_97879 [Epithele typhae]|uniref:uncharacterized protein n=1 Tax=Epithele typhae TaxID=378194 RepID=UPI0020076BE0|nr:uncharacterized protein BXZ73DRAFT_97879 [Epithele typhae]KAH9942470.1 hypothetical protein BXZ73DRAFT_97879 [Epithele typhae]
MADSLSTPWILDYCISVAEEHGGDLLNIPWKTKGAKVQLVKFISFPPIGDEPSTLWATLSDKKHLITARLTKDAVANYADNPLNAGHSITSRKTAFLILKKCRPAFGRVARGPSTGMSSQATLYFEVDAFEARGSYGEPMWGEPVEVESDQNIKEWIHGLRRDGGAGNVLKLRKQEAVACAEKQAELAKLPKITAVQSRVQATMEDMQGKVPVARRSRKSRPSEPRPAEKPKEKATAVSHEEQRRATWKRFYTRMVNYSRPPDEIFDQWAELSGDASIKRDVPGISGSEPIKSLDKICFSCATIFAGFLTVHSRPANPVSLEPPKDTEQAQGSPDIPPPGTLPIATPSPYIPPRMFPSDSSQGLPPSSLPNYISTPRFREPQKRRVPLPRIADLQRDPDTGGEGRVLVENSDTASPGSHRAGLSQSQSQNGSQGQSQSQAHGSTQSQNQTQEEPSQSQRKSTLRHEVEPGSTVEEPPRGDDNQAHVETHAQPEVQVEQESQESQKSRQSLSYKDDSQSQGGKSRQSLSYKDSQSQDQDKQPEADVSTAPVDDQRHENDGDQAHSGSHIAHSEVPSREDHGNELPGQAEAGPSGPVKRSSRSPRLKHVSLTLASKERAADGEGQPRVEPSWEAIRAPTTSEDESDKAEVDELLTSSSESEGEDVRRKDRSRRPVKAAGRTKSKTPAKQPSAKKRPRGEYSPDDECTRKKIMDKFMALRHPTDAGASRLPVARGGSPEKQMQPSHTLRTRPAHDPSVWEGPTFLKPSMSKAQPSVPTLPDATSTALKRSARPPLLLEEPPAKKRKTGGSPSVHSLTAPYARPDSPSAPKAAPASHRSTPFQRHDSDSSVQSAATSSTKVTAASTRMHALGAEPSRRSGSLSKHQSDGYVNLYKGSRPSSRSSSRQPEARNLTVQANIPSTGAKAGQIAAPTLAQAPASSTKDIFPPVLSAAKIGSTPGRPNSTLRKQTQPKKRPRERAASAAPSDLGSRPRPSVRAPAPPAERAELQQAQGPAPTQPRASPRYVDPIPMTQTRGGPPVLNWGDLEQILLAVGRHRFQEQERERENTGRS